MEQTQKIKTPNIPTNHFIWPWLLDAINSFKIFPLHSITHKQLVSICSCSLCLIYCEYGISAVRVWCLIDHMKGSNLLIRWKMLQFVIILGLPFGYQPKWIMIIIFKMWLTPTDWFDESKNTITNVTNNV